MDPAAKLAANARGWLESPGSAVKIAVTVDIDQDEPFVTIVESFVGVLISKAQKVWSSYFIPCKHILLTTTIGLGQNRIRLNALCYRD